ncbi:MAG: polysaccharide biosynthesis/export family protein [Sphingopyxis sp.]|uniref:polysaccharide biosynthesis/export family protein n=1 Tax=Sphingopyxis sp. TaxID=1908224 RepID=UPI002ABB2FA0|nr:polysaccharide biosynthesis/export family protein [Sphingopyxis sp.]MDZ3830816.1 polysaccharide biosynthesis/export family protein [Sphingopyxis sp.]
MKITPSIALMTGTCLIAGCATMPTPRNLPAAQYQAEQQLSGAVPAPCALPPVPAPLSALARVEAGTLAEAPDLLGPGDRLRLAVSGDKNILSGSYVVGANGRLTIDGVADIAAAGRPLRRVERDLRSALLANGLIRDIAANVQLSAVEAAGVQVSVSGAVFEPGLVRAGERSADARATTVDHPAAGDFNAGRALSSALRAAGGIRPDAAAGSIYLIRGDHYAVIDVTAAFSGGVPADPQLAAGDRIIVPSAGCFQPQFVRPSSVTAPGVRVYLSNLSRPAASNAASAIGRDSTSFPYGARMLEGLVSANCVGGSALNAARRAVLISRNPTNGHSVVIARHVEELVRDASRDGMNPFLMPGDAIACYDSSAMTLVDAVGVVGSLLGPAALAHGLTKN